MGDSYGSDVSCFLSIIDTGIRVERVTFGGLRGPLANVLRERYLAKLCVFFLEMMELVTWY